MIYTYKCNVIACETVHMFVSISLLYDSALIDICTCIRTLYMQSVDGQKLKQQPKCKSPQEICWVPPLQPTDPKAGKSDIQLQYIIYYYQVHERQRISVSPLVVLLVDFLVKNSLNGLSGTGINFPTAARGQLIQNIINSAQVKCKKAYAQSGHILRSYS